MWHIIRENFWKNPRGKADRLFVIGAENGGWLDLPNERLYYKFGEINCNGAIYLLCSMICPAGARGNFVFWRGVTQ